jgi:glycerol dehydrogenase-like iron-containing ADH family enzyme
MKNHKELQRVRWAVKGWAFAHPDKLPGYLQHASAIRDELPEVLWAEADEIIRPVRERISGL